jgi:hypothetical protein
MKKFRLTAALSALAFAAWAGPVHAVENVTPYLPGISVGTPSGAAPPPGLYGIVTLEYLNGPLVDNNGNNKPGDRVSSASIEPGIIWAPNFKVLGASYDAVILQSISQQSLQLDGAGLGTTVQNGLFNTIIVPANLSWTVAPGMFVSTGLTFYPPDGTYQDVPITINGVHGRINSPSSIANNTWAFEPDVAFSYLADGWNLSGKALIDLQTENPSTHYQSGNVFFFDWTAEHRFGKWQAGIGGDVGQQLNNDTGFGAPANGNKFSLVTLGPVASYDFGPVTLQAVALLPVEATNGGKISEVFLSALWGF